MNKLYIYCDGGIGNRLNSLIGGIYLANLLLIDYEILWPENRWCGAKFEDIFNIELNSSNKSQLDLNKELNENFYLISHDKQSFKSKFILNPLAFFFKKSLLKKIEKKTEIIIYHCPQIPFYISSKDAMEICKIIKFQDYLIEDTTKFLRNNKLNFYSYYGLHLRGTDAKFSSLKINIIKCFVFLLPFKFMLCTDDDLIIKEFSKFQNVIIRKNINYPKKIEPQKDWNSSTQDEYGRIFNYNIQRDLLTIKDSIFDFQILTCSKLIYTSRSTFLENVYRLRGIKSFFFEIIYLYSKFKVTIGTILNNYKY